MHVSECVLGGRIVCGVVFVCVVGCISMCEGLNECMGCGVCVFVCGFACLGG